METILLAFFQMIALYDPYQKQGQFQWQSQISHGHQGWFTSVVYFNLKIISNNLGVASSANETETIVYKLK